MTNTSVSTPREVISNIEILKQANIWHIVSTNPPVRSCVEAARRRRRLGNIGIPLCDELKSNVGRVRTADGTRYVVVHCRGHQQLDEEKLEHELDGVFQRISEQELNQEFGAIYGSVTPLAFIRNQNILQIVDPTVLMPFFPPYTMMTNLGHLEYAVEFYPSDLFSLAPNTRVVDVVVEPVKAPTSHTVGILTGNSPESGILLWEKINQRIRDSRRVRFRGDISFPRVLVESVPEMGLSMELSEREEVVRSVVTQGVEKLCAGGATLICIACNTTQYFGSEVQAICNQYAARYISIVDETARFLKHENIRRCDLMAITSVSDFSKWSDFRRIVSEFEINVPSEKHIAAITELAFSVKREVVSAATINKLRDLVNNATTTDVVLIALTELSVLFASQKGRQRSTKRFVDTLDLLAERVSNIYLEQRLNYGDALASTEY